MSENTPAGWYPAQHANNELRYWDGSQWHEQAAADATGVRTAVIDGGPSASATATAPTPSQALSLTALILGIAAFLFGLVPWFGLLLAAAAVGVSAIALLRTKQRIFSLIGLILGGIALLTGIIVAIVFTIGVSNAASTTASADGAPQAEGAAGAGDLATASPVPTTATVPTSAPQATEAAEAPAQPESKPAPAPPAAKAGTPANPLPQPYTAKGLFGGEKYSLTASVVDANAGALVKEWNQFNSDAPAGFKYVIVQLTMTGIAKDGVEPLLAEWDLSLATAEGNRYDSEIIVMGDDMPSMSDGPTLYPGSSFTGYTAYIVPEGAQSFLLFDNGNYIAL